MARQNNDEFKFEIKEHVCVLRENDKGWKLELTRVSWNGRPAKYDIREWSPDYTKMGKGITLCDHEAETLAAAIANNYIKNHADQFAEPEWKPEASSTPVTQKAASNPEKREADIVPFRSKKKNDPQPLNKQPEAKKEKPKTKQISGITVPANIELPF